MDEPMISPVELKSPNMFHAESVYLPAQNKNSPTKQEQSSFPASLPIAFSFCGQEGWVEKPPAQTNQEIEREETPGFLQPSMEQPALSVLRGHLFEEYNEFKVPSDFAIAKLHRVVCP